MNATPDRAESRLGNALRESGAAGAPSRRHGERSLAESVALILRGHREAVLTALYVVLAGVALGVLLQEIQSKYGDLGPAAVVALTAAALLAIAVMLAFPVLLIVACVAIAFSSSSAALHAHYGLPVTVKYLPPVLLGTVALYQARRSHAAFVPRRLWLGSGRSEELSVPFVLCLSLLGVYFVFTLIPLLYASDTALAFDELELQNRRLLLALAIALSVGRFGRWSSLSFMCTIALYATSGVILLAMLGSFHPPLERLLPGFAFVYSGDEIGDAADRIAGAFGHPNSLGRYAVFAMPLAIGVAFVSRGVHRALALLCLLVLVAGMTLSESRGAILVFGILALPAMMLAARYVAFRYWASALAVAAIVIVAAWQHVDTERMNRSLEDAERLVVEGGTPSDGATRGRLSEMRIAYELWKLHPFVGVGLANYEHYFQIYSYDFGTKLYNRDRAAHSLYLELLAERGIVGLFGFLFAIGGIVVTVLVRAARMLRAGDRVVGSLMLAMVCSAAAYYLSAMLLHDVHSSPIWALTGLMIAGTRHASRSDTIGAGRYGDALRTRERSR